MQQISLEVAIIKLSSFTIHITTLSSTAKSVSSLRTYCNKAFLDITLFISNYFSLNKYMTKIYMDASLCLFLIYKINIQFKNILY